MKRGVDRPQRMSPTMRGILIAIVVLVLILAVAILFNLATSVDADATGSIETFEFAWRQAWEGNSCL